MPCKAKTENNSDDDDDDDDDKPTQITDTDNKGGRRQPTVN